MKVVVYYDGQVFESVDSEVEMEGYKDQFYEAIDKLGKFEMETEDGFVMFGEGVIQNCVFKFLK